MQEIPPGRIQRLNRRRTASGRYVLYWMQQSQRAVYNHALEYAVEQANALDKPLVVGFGLTAAYPEANRRHYVFMAEGLEETARALARRGIRMVIRRGAPDDTALALGGDACLIVCDRGYLRHQKAWRARVAREAACPVVQVESDAVVPVEVVSAKVEYAARTIRPRIHRHLERYLVPLRSGHAKRSSLELAFEEADTVEADALPLLAGLALDDDDAPVSRFFKGGTSRAEARFDAFMQDRFPRYVDNRNQPQTDDISHMSPYLHFGQISPLYLALEVSAAPDRHAEARRAFLEELIVRRELAANFVHYHDRYDSFDGLPPWARNSLAGHRNDPREPLYNRAQLEAAETHDSYWNAAMREMKHTGFMHNYMRMYWGKKILEWTRTPEHGFRTALALNNKYFLDGRDPNSYAGVGWVFGLHDRAWAERAVYGKVRYMAASGLERKCDIGGYLKKVEQLEKR